MVCCSLVGCADTELEELHKVISGGTTSSSNPEMTISLYCVCDYVTPEAKSEVQDALNAITVKKFNTKIELFLFTEDEYSKVVYSKATSCMNAYIQDMSDDDIEKYGYTAVNFSNVDTSANFGSNSELSSATFDIFLMYTPGSDTVASEKIVSDTAKMFDLMYEQKVLVDIQNYCKSSYSDLGTVSYTEFYNAVNRKDMFNLDSDSAKYYYYAIPNNYLLGEYEYLIVNTEAVKDTYTQYDKLGFDLDDNNAPTPNPNLKWLISALEDKKENNEITVDNVYVEYSSYADYNKATETFAIAKVNGSLAIKELITNPKLEVVQVGMTSGLGRANYMESMWGISRAYDSSLASSGITESDRINRCLDIIDLLENDKDFRNTLQYGVNGVHYSLGRDGTAQSSSNDYKMNYKYTGNLFVLYPSDTMDADIRKLAEDSWALAKAQNTSMITNSKKQSD